MEGNAAAKDRCPLSDNPYEFGTWQRTAWLAGWIDTHERGFHTENEAGSPGDPKYQLARCKAPQRFACSRSLLGAAFAQI